MTGRWPPPSMLLAVVLLAAVAFYVSAIAVGCSERNRPTATTPLSEAHRGIPEDLLGRWASSPDLPPVTDECAAYLRRAEIAIVDRETLLHLCWRDEPGRCEDGTSRSKYGCTAGCADQGSDCTG